MIKKLVELAIISCPITFAVSDGWGLLEVAATYGKPSPKYFMENAKQVIAAAVNNNLSAGSCSFLVAIFIFNQQGIRNWYVKLPANLDDLLWVEIWSSRQ